MKTLRLLNFFSLLICLSLLNSCKKSLIDSPATPELPDLETMIASSVTGFVTNEADEAVSGAMVKLGSSTATTDQFGYFKFSDVQVVKTAAVISIEEDGYFKAFRTYVAREGETPFVRIKLLQKSLAGTIDAISGGVVDLTNGLSIRLPANAVIMNSTGTAYGGSVSVYAKLTDPVSEEHIQTMPGDNRGLDKNGAMKLLTSYGISAVELKGDAGQELQIAPGKKATLKIPINTTAFPSAPTSIPLWHFNESSGLWEEQGVGLRSGNFYVSDVSHFSFWNCSPPLDAVNFSVRLVDAAGQGVPFAYVKLTDVSNPANRGASFTDQNGHAFGIVPANTAFSMAVSNGYGCDSPVYTQQVQTGNGVSLGNISLPATALTTVTGTVYDCSMQPVTNGYIMMEYAGMHSRYNISQAAPFSFTTLVCGNISANFIAADLINMQESAPIAHPITPGLNQLGSLQACGVNTMEFVNCTVNGNTISLSSPDIFSESLIGAINATLLQASDTTTDENVSFAYNYPGTIGGADQPLKKFFYQPSQDSLTVPTSPYIYVHFTQYEPVGGFITGSFTGTLTGRPPANLVYNVNCNFKVRRRM